MAGYSYQQLEQLWTQNGGDSGRAPVMAAIAIAESGGNPNAVSPTSDYGLWQINQGNFGGLGLNSQSALDPVTNTKAAIALSRNGANIGDWCTAWSNSTSCASGPLTIPQPGSPAFKVLASYGKGDIGIQGVDSGTTRNVAGDPGGPQNLGLVTPDRCLVGPVFGFCFVTAGGARKIKGYSVMVAGGAVLAIGVLMLGAYGLKSSAAKAALPSEVTRRALRGQQARRSAEASEERRQVLREERQTDRESAASARRYGAGGGSQRTQEDEEPFPMPTRAERAEVARRRNERNRQRVA